MPVSLARATLAATVMIACTPAAPTTAGGAAPQTAAPPPSRPPAEPGWTDAGGGLSVRLDVPPGPHKLGATVDVGLEFRNDSDDDLRVYLIDSPPFRALQSDLAVLAADGKFLASQPEPHPHGYVVTERDFPAIPAGGVQRFSQPLRLDREQLGAGGDLQVRWTYRNKIDSWAGGVQTLDGPTRPLFGGGLIPGIWLGELSLTAPLRVTP